MAKGRKLKSRRSERASSPGSTAAAEAPDALPAESTAPEKLLPHPPRRNPALLVISIVFLAIWLAALVWLAATA
jgi:hypothetical protein